MVDNLETETANGVGIVSAATIVGLGTLAVANLFSQNITDFVGAAVLGSSATLMAGICLQSLATISKKAAAFFENKSNLLATAASVIGGAVVGGILGYEATNILNAFDPHLPPMDNTFLTVAGGAIGGAIGGVIGNCVAHKNNAKIKMN